jgi:RHS repeat-associated protein
MPGVGTLAYDARNRITGAGGVPTRGYDPGNRKVWWKDSNGITFVDYWLPNGERLVTYKIDESTYYSNQSYTGPVQFSTISRYLHFAGRQVKVEGRYGVGGYVEWPQPDRLSSHARHHPYGEERGTSSTEYKFATYQREASGLDYALNRYYSSVYGRFLSSDPYRASGGPSDPGSWNRYAYVQGDPVNFSDPEGLFRSCPNRDGCRAQHIFDDFIRTDESMGGGGLDVGSGRGFAGRDGAGGGSRPSPMPPPPLCGVNPVSGTPGFSAKPKGQTGHLRPGVGGDGAFNARRRRRDGTRYPHEGLDISGVSGETSIVASLGGTVTFVGQQTGHGSTVVIDVGNGYSQLYSHLDSFAAGIKVGDMITQGTALGILGQTGRATGDPPSEAHLHFGVSNGSSWVDPASFLNSPCPWWMP